MAKALLLDLKLANVLFWFAIILASLQVQAFYIDITFPTFKNEATQERALYYEGDSLLVTWSSITWVRELNLYCSGSDELSWGDHEYGRGVMDFTDYWTMPIIGNAKNSECPQVRRWKKSAAFFRLSCHPKTRGKFVSCRC